MVAAMRRRDAAQVACIRQLKSKVQEAVNAPGFAGDVDDALHERVIGSYVKSLEKAIVELAAGGARSQPLCDQYSEEIRYLRQYLPQPLTAPEITALAATAAREQGITDPKQGGKLLGALMRSHGPRLEAKLAKRIIDELLQRAQLAD